MNLRFVTGVRINISESISVCQRFVLDNPGKPHKKEHIKEFGGRYALEVSRRRFGGRVPGTSGA